MTRSPWDLIRDARRVVVKVGSSSLTLRGSNGDQERGGNGDPVGNGDQAGAGGAGSVLAGVSAGIDVARVTALVDALTAAGHRGSELVLVSSGAIATGIAPLGLRRRPRDLASAQAAASVGQGILMAHYHDAFARHGRTVGQVLLTADDLVRRAHYRNAQRTLERLLELGVVPIVNENDTVATAEIRFGDNDRLAALVAHLVRADALVLLSDVEGLYDGPPQRRGTRLVREVASAADLEQVAIGGTGAAGVGLGGMATKVEAARIATEAGIPVVLTAAANAAQALAGQEVGTFFHATGDRSASRLLWLAHATSSAGQIHLDAGAVAAVRDRGASLLPAGITHVVGGFVARDPVDLVGPDGALVGRGLVAYDAVELPTLLGRSTRELAAALGPEYEREVVHRDDMVLLR
ncbi:MAG: glutamate 5-kinase [Candidatus Nanopelagicales bacterium]|jgi:glutamate 5-kinase|nr:glutamate 5-kinase [Candidatus Nanopelagicales bacterium]